MRRQQIKQPSIRERRLKEILLEDEAKIAKELENKFKAKPMPPEVKIPMFDLIMKEQEERRIKVKEHSEAITKSLEKPFSFYYRDMAKPTIKQENFSSTVIPANPVPWFCKVSLMKKFEKEEEIRKDRISKMARESLSHAKMPARMESAKNEKKQKKQKSQTTFKFKAKEVPDFKNLQESFIESLSALKQSFTPTHPQPFNFHVSHRSEESLKLLDFQSEALQHWAKNSKKSKKRAKSAFSKPKILPGNTKKTVNMIEAKQHSFLMEQQKKQEKLEEEEKKALKHETMVRLMKKSAVIKKINNESEYNERLKAKKQQIRRNEVEYNMKLQEIREKVAQRPLLLEQMASNSISKGFENIEPVKRMLNQEYISEAFTSQEQEGSDDSFA